MLIQEGMIKQLLQDMQNEQYRDDYDEIRDEWAYHNHNTIEAGGKEWTAKLEHPVHSARWELIKKIVAMYDKQEKKENGKIKWAKPLCDMELCTTSLTDNTTHLLQQLQKQQEL